VDFRGIYAFLVKSSYRFRLFKNNRTSFLQRILDMPRLVRLKYATIFLVAICSLLFFHQNTFAQQPCLPNTPNCSVPTTCDTEIGCQTGCSTSSCGLFGTGYDTLGLYGRADAVFWTLGGSDRALIQRFDSVNGGATTAFTANDFQTTRATPRILLGLQLTPVFAIEGQYNGFSPWKSTRTLNTDLLLPGALGTVANDYLLADRMIVRSETSFHTAEFNFVRKIKQSNVSTLAGFRYINFDEKFGLNSTPNLAVPNHSSDYLVHAKNDLYGGQLGLKWNPKITNRFGLDIVGKAGVYGNNASQRSWMGDDNNVTEHRNVSMKKNATAFVGELNFGGNYKITEGLSFIGGYNLLWVGDTARAADQLDFTYTATSSQFVATDTLFMHGANVGLAWNF